jgi:lysozyme
MSNYKLSQAGYQMICNLEGVRTQAYRDAVGIPTIGIGFIHVAGLPVKMGDTLTLDQVKTEFLYQIVRYEQAVNTLVTSQITQPMFDSLVSFAFNLGTTALAQSTLLKRVNHDPQDPSIKQEFLRWDEAGGHVISGLLKRRQTEANNYFSR